MTISKKLYVNFGAVLAMVIVLFLVNLIVVQREHSAKAAASQALEMADTTDNIRFQMMQNRLYLSNYLLSGDSREVDRMNDGVHQLNDSLQSSLKTAISDQQRSALESVQKNESAWVTEFAQPMLQKRREVDAGNATVADLQIYYLQKHASSWVKTSTDSLNVANHETNHVLEDGLSGLVRQRRDASSQRASASSQGRGASDESAQISLQTSSAIDEGTSTMQEMSVNVQNMVKRTQVQASRVSETSASIDEMVA